MDIFLDVIIVRATIVFVQEGGDAVAVGRLGDRC